MLESLGARLRQRREEQEIPLITIADQTKIKLSLLEALERDDVSHWPSGIFRRAFIRAYAQAIGLNPDVVVREFLETYPDPIELIAMPSAISETADRGRINGGPPTRFRYLVGSAIGSLSRLRRNPTVEDPGAGDAIPVDRPSPAEPDLPVIASHPSPELSHREPSPPEPSRVEMTNEVVADCPLANETASFEPDFLAVAQLCTEFGRVENRIEVQPLLQEAARILDATGVIVWVWDAGAAELRSALAHGYSDRVLAQLPAVRRDADNATAAAFRSAQICAINGGEQSSSALVVPLLTPAGCSGVFAIELQHGSEQTRSVRAVATIFAAQLAQLIGGARPDEAGSLAEAINPPMEKFTPAICRASG
jgi:hypothetical protein